MQSLLVLYSALAVFGLGVTIVDLFGVFDQASPSGEDAGGADAPSDSGDDSADSDASGHDGDSGGEADSGIDGGSGDHSPHDADATEGQDAAHTAESGHAHGDRGSYVAAASAGTRLVAKTIGTLRSGVYFS
ncbi:MAG TPA: hypothetical protein DCG47_12445, partial [Spirochaetaceae bacterium]|nr:hypothetical protein [Spirochaetaceae bacterium]